MKYLFLFLTLLFSPAHANSLDKVNQKSWIHGSEDCINNNDPAIDIYQFSESTFVLRQNKCVHFEAPFIYVLFGEHTVFVQDTGATAEAELFPLYETLQEMIANWSKSHHINNLNLLITHSHSHSDHRAADLQFRGKPGVTLVEPDADSVHQYFGFTDWPQGTSTVDLGGRELTIIPVPGHQKESIAIYDPQTQWLLTGDTFYPGRLYIKDWEPYKSSIQRLLEFSNKHEISAIMGTHIEMSTVAGKDYPAGSTYQPDEAGLALSVKDLLSLNNSLDEIGDKAEEKTMAKFIIAPIGLLQRTVGGFVGWLRNLAN